MNRIGEMPVFVMSEIDKIRTRLKPLGFDNDDLAHAMELNVLIEDAEIMVLSHCRREDFTEVMRSAVRDLVVIYWLRRGTEGESSRTESGISQSFEVGIPENVMKKLQGERILVATVERF